ncbi:dTMP kinase [Cohaesibacter celericrescens]|uniref:Thymidylate kinase n=1 Tax=Cohaesibacter celericrescens TaxID=2067669 RepID=A0A2N5XSX5_9HYPH|nr:dTMP kinase [Cohaesibacter celericrescens]PLW77612.1 dTMP kinase [Cohaesibacter celericrescens]
MQRGKFITFEGGEGVGKTTQIRLLTERLAARGINCIKTREPGGSPGGEAVRHVLLSGAAEKLGIGPRGEAILFAAARADHVDTKIRPALDRGQWVLCDRFMDSTRIYQGEHTDVPQGLVDILERIAIDGLRPDLTFVLDLRAEIGMNRANTRRTKGEIADRFEREDLSIHKNRRNAFLQLARQDPARCKVIDASQTVDEISFDIWQIVERELLLKEQGQTALLQNEKEA